MIEPRKFFSKEEFIATLILALAFALLVHSVFYVLTRIKLLMSLPQFLKADTLRHPVVVAVLLASMAIVAGAAASLWKQNSLRSYGMAEIVFGTLLTFNSILHLAPDFEFAKFFAIGTAVYVIASYFPSQI